MNNPPRRMPFVLAASNHGSMIVNSMDFDPQVCLGVGGEILNKGHYDPDHVKLTRFILEMRRKYHGDGVVAIDCGANIGVFTIEWAKLMTGWGSVIAFEPQEFIYYALAGNIALNNCGNARAVQAAIGADAGMIGMPEIDYEKPANFGGVTLDAKSRGEHQLMTIDSWEFPRVDLIKIDVEGMELDVLTGAACTIEQCRPAMLIEFHKVDEAELRNRLLHYGYHILQSGKIDFLAIHKDDPITKHFARDPNDVGAR